MDKKSLQEKLDSIAQRFNAQENLKESLQKQLTDTNEEMLRLAGAHREINELMNALPEVKSTKKEKK